MADGDGEVIRAAKEAWRKLNSTRTIWDEWVVLGRGLQLGQQQVFDKLGITKPYGRGYQRAMREWLDANGFADIDPATRSRLLFCMANLPAITAWRGTLSEAVRMQVNSPLTVWKTWAEGINFASEMDREGDVESEKDDDGVEREIGIRLTPNVDDVGNVAPVRSAEGRGGWAYVRAVSFEDDNEWYSPPYIFQGMGCRFDLDPASPGPNVAPWIPADRHYSSGGLDREWSGFVWLNAPYGRAVLPGWIDKFIEHGNGIVLVSDRTSTQWWQKLAGRSDLILFLNRKIRFIRPDEVEPFPAAYPIAHALVAYGERGVEGLREAHRNGLGLLMARV